MGKIIIQMKIELEMTLFYIQASQLGMYNTLTASLQLEYSVPTERVSWILY